MSNFTTTLSCSNALQSVGFLKPCNFYWVLLDSEWVLRYKKEIYISDESVCFCEGVICKYTAAYTADELTEYIPECVRMEKNFKPDPSTDLLETYYICGEIEEDVGVLSSWKNIQAGTNIADSCAQLIIFITQSNKSDII